MKMKLIFCGFNRSILRVSCCAFGGQSTPGRRSLQTLIIKNGQAIVLRKALSSFLLHVCSLSTKIIIIFCRMEGNGEYYFPSSVQTKYVGEMNDGM